jgi:endonuclease/exonuclease/phosphatase family metal-dependent hydrolase
VYVQTIVMRFRVLTWNLMHGRSRPPARRDLLREFATALAGWEWDVALLQEVPPWWPARLGAELEAEYRFVLTSRNGLLSARRAIAVRWPDLIRSNGGGANAILARHDRIVAHRTLRLARFPERRWAHATWLACGFWVVNVHASGEEVRAQRDGELVASTSLQWAGGAPLVGGGDFNLREPQFNGLRHAAERDVDHIFIGAGLQLIGPPEVLDRGALSDHPPLVVTVQDAPGDT